MYGLEKRGRTVECVEEGKAAVEAVERSSHNLPLIVVHVPVIVSGDREAMVQAPIKLKGAVGVFETNDTFDRARHLESMAGSGDLSSGGAVSEAVGRRRSAVGDCARSCDRLGGEAQHVSSGLGRSADLGHFHRVDELVHAPGDVGVARGADPVSRALYVIP